MTHRIFRTLAATVLLAALAGCAVSPREFEIDGSAAPVINRDGNGNPLSIVIRIYQMNGRSEFDRLTVDSLASGKQDSELLSTELVSRAERILVPGASWRAVDTLDPATRYIGVVGLFRQPDPQNWRFIVDAEGARKAGFSFIVEDCYLHVIRPEATLIPGQSSNYLPECGLAANNRQTSARH
jgi:type VI secretion system protein VasD